MIGMDTMTTAAHELERLCNLIERETASYRRLWRLAVRQNSYMRRGDTERLEANAREWDRWLPDCESLQAERSEAQRALVERHGWPRDAESVVAWAERNAHPQVERLTGLRDAWREAAEELNRQNALNGDLARFCLDLVADETEIFRRGIGEEQGGGYDDQGQLTGAVSGGVVTHRA